MSIPIEHRVTSRTHFLTFLLLAVLAFGLGACAGSEPETAEPEAPAQPEEAAAEDPSVELEFWQSVKDSGDADQLLAYIKKYPEGQFVELAETRLKNLAEGGPQDDPNVAGPGASNVDPPQAQAPAPPPPRLSRSDRVMRVVNRALARYSDPRLHVHPNVPRVKADNAASIHGMDPRKILVLYDDGFRGGGKTGFAITDRRIYWRFVSGADALYLDFQDIQSAIARKNKFLLNGYDVSTTMSGNSRQAAEVYADLALALRDEFR
ncbi:MAG: hypothetical protein AAF560_17435 [Acidobacteriota bacterium]